MNRTPLYVFAAAFGLAVLAAPAAHAFTIEDRSAPDGGATAKKGFTDSRFSKSNDGDDKDGPGTYRNGNATLKFGPAQGSSNRNFNPSSMFEPNGRPFGER